MTTHYMKEAKALYDRVAITDAGRLVILDAVPGLIVSIAKGMKV